MKKGIQNIAKLQDSGVRKIRASEPCWQKCHPVRYLENELVRKRRKCQHLRVSKKIQAVR
jgi:hypothetical protein